MSFSPVHLCRYISDTGLAAIDVVRRPTPSITRPTATAFIAVPKPFVFTIPGRQCFLAFLGALKCFTDPPLAGFRTGHRKNGPVRPFGAGPVFTAFSRIKKGTLWFRGFNLSSIGRFAIDCSALDVPDTGIRCLDVWI